MNLYKITCTKHGRVDIAYILTDSMEKAFEIFERDWYKDAKAYSAIENINYTKY